MATLFLFADSNLFLHYKSLKQIDWSSLGDFDNFEVVACRTAQREIDALKDGRSGGRSDRARRAASILPKIAQHGPQVQRGASPRVVLKLYGASQPKQVIGAQLDYSQNDNRIIGHMPQCITDSSTLAHDPADIDSHRSMGSREIGAAKRRKPEADNSSKLIAYCRRALPGELVSEV